MKRVLLTIALLLIMAAWAAAQPGPRKASSNLVTFQVDMSYHQAYLNPGDIVGLRGGSEPLSWFSTTPMQDPEEDEVYTVTIDFSSVPIGNEIQYKFVHHDPGVTNIVWEEPLSTGGGNRSFNLAEGGQTLPMVKWDDVDQPFVIPRFDVYTTHSPQGYGFGAWVDVYDSLGLAHIDEVKIIAPSSSEYTIYSEAPGNPRRFSRHVVLGATPPELGLYTIEATNLTSETLNVQENITNYVEQLPTGSYPPNAALIPELQPVFDWDDVSDPNSSITYNINVHRRDNGQWIWGAGGLGASEAVFNFDGSANENLQQGLSYDWYVNANDEFGNSSEWNGHFAVGSGLVMIDGVKEAFWNTVTGQVSIGSGQLVYGEVDSEEDGSAVLYLAYDESYLYGFFEAQDDIMGSQNNSDWWRNDAFSLGFDLGVASTIPVPPGLGEEPNAWDIIHLGFTAEAGFPGNANGTPNTIAARTLTAGGYVIEFAVPVAEIRNERISPPETIALMEGTQVGFALQLLDKDFEDGFFDAKMVWGHASASDRFYNDVTQFGNMLLLADHQIALSQENLVMPPEMPFVQVPGVRSRHWDGGAGESWELELWVHANDQQGLTDLDMVWVEKPEGGQHQLYDDGNHNDNVPNDGRFAFFPGGLNQAPSVGAYLFKARDNSGDIASISQNLDNVIEQIPAAIYPPHGSIIATTLPIFNWQEVSDPPAAITYNLNVHRHDNGQWIWGAGGLTTTAVTFNFDGSAQESLQEGTSYDWNINAHDDFGNSSSWSGSFTVSSGDGPVIVSFDVWTNHDQGGYRIDAWANVVDPQGQSDISTVKLIDAENNEYVLNYQGGNSFSGGAPSMPDPPPLGITRIVALDQAANSDTVSENLTNFVEELPVGIYPPEGGIIGETLPAFDWQDVSDPQSAITYSVFVDRRDTGQNIWAAYNLTASEAVYNFNGTATEALQDGMSYNWNINARDQFGNSAWWGTYFIVSTGDGPVITGFDLSTHHNRWGDYFVNGWADVVDPQGLGDIQQVKVIDANGLEFTLNYEGWGNRYSGGHNYGGTPPPLGETRIVVLDQSANADTASENLNNFVEEIPTAVYPPDNGLITETTPVFDWEDVTDPQSAITYSINVHRRDNNQWIWGVGNLTQSTALFNFNGSALENLQDGMGYNWYVNANDQFGNSSAWDGNFAISSGDGPVIVNFDFWTYHGPWGYNLGAWADVLDPQGNADLQTIKAIDAAGNQFTLNFDGGNRYSNSIGYGENLPPFGLGRIVVIDVAAHSDTASENINNVIEQLPQAIHPPPNGYFSSDPPGTFQFSAVTDEQTTINEHHLRVYHNGNEIWFRSLPGNQHAVVFNDNGQAAENLLSGEVYTWNVWALASDGNNSETGYPYFTAVQEPFATNVQAQPGFLAPDESVTISARCWDADGLSSVIADIESPDENVLASLTLFDDGSHNDGAANDSVFANTWVTPGAPATFFVDIELQDTQAHSRSFNNAATFSTNVSVLPQQWTTDAADDIDPSLAPLPDGRFFLVFSSFRTGQQEILWQTSLDMGASWSTPESLTPGSTNNRRPHAFKASNDAVWVLWERDGQIYYRTSDNNAASWSDETQLVQLNDFNLNPRMAQTSSGRLWVSFSNIGQGDAYDVFGVYSDDNGASWSNPQPLTNNPGNDHYANLAGNSGGTLFLVWDQFGGGLQPDIYMKTSNDNGQTWSDQTLITNDSQRNAFDGFLIDANDRMHLVFGELESPGWQLQYQFSDDAGNSWSNRTPLTRYRGHDYVPKLAEISGSPWMVFFSERSGNFDVWAGIVNQMQDLDPPPFISFTEHTPGGPDPDDMITLVGEAYDETGLAGVELIFAVNGAPQANLAMYDDGSHGDATAGDNRYTVQIGPYSAGTGIDYQVRATDNDANTFTSPASPRHFDVLDFFAKQHEVLLIADDQSNRYLHYYTSALEANGYAYDVWERWVRGEIDSTILQEYRNGVVVWYCGHSYLTLSPNERNALGPFLNAGGKLFITEQDLGYDLNMNQPAAEWYHDYLHANFVQDNVGLLNLQGVAGDALGDGLSFAIAGGDGANNQSWPSEIDPIAPAVSILQYTSGSAAQANSPRSSLLFEEELFAAKPWSKPAEAAKQSKSNPAIEDVISSGSGGLRIDNGSHKLVYLAFGFEGIADEGNRSTLMGRVMNWLAGPPPMPQWLAPLSVNAIATQSDELPEISSFNLAFGGHPNATDGFDDGLDVFTAPPGFNYYAYFAISDLPYFLSTDYRGWLAPFEAARDFTLSVVNALNLTSEVSWDVAALPPEGSFRLKEPVLGFDIDMRQQSSVQFTGNATLLIQYRPIQCVTFDFEVPDGAWYLISLPVVPEDNSVEALFPGAAGAFGWNYAGQNYDQVANLEPEKAYWLLMMQAKSVEVCGQPVQTYTHEYASSGWDLTGAVFTSSPFTADPVNGVLGMFGWNPAAGQYVQISPFTVEPEQGYWILVFNTPCTVTAGATGVAAATAKAGTNAELSGFYEKYGTMPPPPPFSVSSDQSAVIRPAHYGLSQNYPNPFNPETVIEYQLPAAGRVSLKVYNLLGHEIRTLVDRDMPVGYHRVQWDGRSESGQKLESGVYLYRLRAGEFTETRKLVLLK